MKLFRWGTNFGMIRKISDWFGMNFNLKLSPGFELKQFNFNRFDILKQLSSGENKIIGDFHLRANFPAILNGLVDQRKIFLLIRRRQNQRWICRRIRRLELFHR